ncbi:hypothetical protein AVEN_194579-1 [Araneus ventricosus]|uniref:Uncharacterized protein n=1 Tax=Araneus ventricosus TaxID=182803 RepID=A0A4Y2A7T8_ARAVE|nr:hypothetical protein AVEN_194579-1 [Araneus ventricosus]
MTKLNSPKNTSEQRNKLRNQVKSPETSSVVRKKTPIPALTNSDNQTMHSDTWITTNNGDMTYHPDDVIPYEADECITDVMTAESPPTKKKTRERVSPELDN